jgi:hypothetical protein
MIKLFKHHVMSEFPPVKFPIRHAIAGALAVLPLGVGIAVWLLLPQLLSPGKIGSRDVLMEDKNPKVTAKGSETRPLVTLSPYTRPSLIHSLREQKPESMTLEQVLRNLSKIPSMPPGDETDARELALVVRWASFDPAKACNYAYEAALDGADESLLREAVSVWARMDPVAASRWAAACRSPMLRDLAMSAVYGLWALSNRQAAIASLRSFSGASARSSALAGVAKGSDRRPKEALAWAASLPAPLRERTLQQVFGSWLRRDPQSAAEWLSRQPTEIQLSLAARLASEWARKDPQSALAWCRIGSPATLTCPQLPSGPIQRRAMEAALSAFVGSDPEAAAAWMMTPPGRTFFPQRASSIASSWASLDPLAAASWASSITSGKERDSAVGAIASTWTRSDPLEALRWIQNIRKVSDRNTALSAFGGTLAFSDPDAAAYWSSQITEKALREDTLSRVISQWRNINAGAAGQFVQTAPAAAFLRKSHEAPEVIRPAR